MSALLEVENLSVDFSGRTAAVRGVSFAVRKGETHCLVGESGCGKSVTALALMNLLARGARRTADGIALFPLFRLLLLRGIAWTAREPVDRFNELGTMGVRVGE